MRCSRAEELMSLSLDGEASSEENRQLQEHIRLCGRCLRRWESFRHVSAFLRSAPSAEPSKSLVASVMQRVGGVELISVEARARRATNRLALCMLAIIGGAALVDLLLIGAAYGTIESGAHVESLEILVNIAWKMGSVMALLASIGWEIALQMLSISQDIGGSSLISLVLVLVALWTLIVKNYRGVPVQH